jgi:AraC-like DNA-binding protein
LTPNQGKIEPLNFLLMLPAGTATSDARLNYRRSVAKSLDYNGQSSNIRREVLVAEDIEILSAVMPENLQRVGFLTHLPQLLRRLGVEPLEVLARAGLSPNALDDPEGTIPYQAMGSLAELCSERTGRPHFGLDIGREIRTASLGALGELMRNSPTLRIALQDFALHQHRHAHGGVVYLLEDQAQAFFGYAVYQPNVPGNAMICDGAAVAAFNIIRELIGETHAPTLEVLISQSEPQNVAHYRRCFGVKVSFDADQTAVAFPRRLLSLPIQGADAQRRIALERLVKTIWHAGDHDIATQLRRELRIGLIRGHVSAASIAAQLGMGRRSLDRRLTAAGLPFQKALDEARCEYARQLLTYTRLEVGKVATIVGYADPSILTRAFMRWVGATPSNWRARRSLNAGFHLS